MTRYRLATQDEILAICRKEKIIYDPGKDYGFKIIVPDNDASDNTSDTDDEFASISSDAQEILNYQEQQNHQNQQIQNLKLMLDAKEAEVIQLKQQLNTLQQKGANMADNNEPVQTQQAIQQWEYRDPPPTITAEDLNELGKEGWEAFAIGGNGGYTNTMLKRPRQPKKQRDDYYGYGR